MPYIKYGLLAAVLLVVTILVLSTPAKESIQEWRPAAVPEKPVVNKSFSASPMSGVAPLTVTFRPALKNTDRISLNFGDGSPRISFDADVSHSYISPGVYNARLDQASGGIYLGEDRYFDPQVTTLQTITITVY